jgi:hypothetical protein
MQEKKKERLKLGMAFKGTSTCAEKRRKRRTDNCYKPLFLGLLSAD